MNVAQAVASLRSRRWTRRCVPWIGALFIAAIAAMAIWDTLRGQRMTVEDTGRELETQARVIAEQTARSVQAVDVVLRHLAQEYEHGALSQLGTQDLHAYLREQAIGLVQIEGLLVTDTSGSLRAASPLLQLPDPPPDISSFAPFQALRRDRNLGLMIGSAVPSPVDGRWGIPMARRLESAAGEFAGIVAARGRVDYFQQFYRDIQLDEGTTITLLHRDGTLLARHPPAETALGQRDTLQAEAQAWRALGRPGPIQVVSPIDGVERFAALRPVPDYPLEIIVTRDAAMALAPWRAQAIGTTVRTVGLGLLAALLLMLLMRQLSRLYQARESLEATRDRFALAVAGSDDGIWDWDRATDLVFVSARARELYGLPPGPEMQSREAWFTTLQLHPDDAPRRLEAMNAHLAGQTPSYEGEYRVRDADGSYRWIRIRGMCVRDANGEPVRMAGSVSDIDARKRAEEALRESEERYAIAMTGSNEGHWVWDVATDEVFASPTLYTMFGLPPDRPLVTRRDFFEQVPIHPDDHVVLRRVAEDHLAGRTAYLDVDYRIVMRDSGEVRWVHSRGQCFRDADGRLVRLAGATVDISQRKRAEEALRESEERSSLAIAGSNDGILYWDIAGDRMYSSERAMEIAGVDSKVTLRSRAEWVALIEFHPDDVQRYTDDLEEHLEGRTAVRDGEYRMRQRDGSYRWVRVRGVCVRDRIGRALRWGGSISDIDARKRAEEALRESEQRYQLAVAGSNEGMWDWDMRHETFFFSARAQELIGLDPGEPMRPCSEWWTLFIHHPDDEKRVHDALSAYLGGEGQHWEVEYRARNHRSGAWHWYRERGVALRDEQGKPYRMAGSMEDISARKSAEAQRDRLEGQLRQSQKLEAMGTLAGGIAHDFNNILAAILGYGEMAQKDAAAGTALRRHIDAALSAGVRAKSLVERILAFSRSGMGERAPVHVQSVVAEALQVVVASLPPDVRLESELDADDAAVMGDPTQLHQVVMNLCANAVQSMKSAGTLSVAVKAMRLDRPLCAATHQLPGGNYVQLTVRDTGSGIAANLLERIFDPFFTTKQVGVGTGLGLSLVHGIVADLGGGIEVQSTVGAGSTFTVYLPWYGSIAAPQAVVEAVAGGDGETILLVDDEEALVRLGEEMMAELGYEPVGFASSAAALETFRAMPQRFDAVLSDEAMPELTGSELAREIRRIRPDIPIVLMTGYVTPALSARAREVGVVEVLSKPLVASDIARSLAGALRRESTDEVEPMPG